MTFSPQHLLQSGGPVWLQAAVGVFLIVHVAAGSVAIASGFGAVLVRKAGTAHRAMGTAFVVSMLMMASMGATLATILKQPGNILGGTLAFYLVVTSWTTIRRRNRRVGMVEVLAATAILGATAALAILASHALQGPHGPGAATLYIVFGVLAAFLAALDLKVILQSGVDGPKRVARHLWRMGLALFFAAGSFFLGQQKVMPAWVQGSPILYVPALAPLALMLFWLIRIRSTSPEPRRGPVRTVNQAN